MSGHLSGGERLKEFMNQKAAKLSEPVTLKVGFLEGATEADGTSIPMIMATQEFGTADGHIPPRPFFRSMIKQNGSSWGDEAAQIAQAHDYDLPATMRLMGEHIKGQLQASIQATNSPPNAPSTVKRKGFDKPLIDTGTAWNSVDYDVSSGTQTE